MTTHLCDVASYLPEKRVPASYFTEFAADDKLAANVMFAAPAFRHHAADEETSADMMIAAARVLTERHGADYLDDVSVVLTHSQLPEVPVRGCGGEFAHRLGLRPTTVLDVHNGGCAAFVHMLNLAGALLRAAGGGRALVALAQNSAAQIFTQEQVRGTAQAPIPGDGAAVAVLALDDPTASPVLASECHSFGQFAGDMVAVAEPDRKYWEAGPGQLRIGFTQARIAKVLARGNRMVPEVAIQVADAAGIVPSQVDWLITNQPNRIFLRNWREALELPSDRHLDTFDECGNLFGVGIPLTFDVGVEQGRIRPGDTVLMSAFAHAGDFSGAALIRWSGRR